ncbi:MAG TPA: S8 family peptidase [Planctomycetota bacterium]|jgi:subtilisin family serine protease|nr:S8 family peptidase [Planctomycetota bacterium]
MYHFHAALLALLATAQTPNPDRLYVEGEVIVRFRDAASPAARDAALTAFALRRDQAFPRLRCELVRAPIPDVEGIVAALRTDPSVEHAQPNYIYRGFASPPQIFPQDPFLDPNSASYQYSALLTRLPSLWRSSNGGAGVTIAILDTGVDLTHAEFAGRLLPGFDFVHQVANPADDNGHGTHVTGIAAAAMNNAGGVGVAPLASILPVKVLANNGAGTTIWVALGLDFAATNGANVVNLSLGSSADDCILREAVADAYAAGCTIVAASGNGGGGPLLAYPAQYDEVIAVGAVGANGTVTSYSQYGPALDVVAPGDVIYSTSLGGGFSACVPPSLCSGTSFAAPFVSGVCALVIEKFPGVKPWEIEAFLRDHTRNTDVFSAGQAGNQDGYGLVSFGSLKDYSNAPLAPAWSNYDFQEWLGADVTGESSMNDVGAVGASDGDDYMPDLDGAPNQSGEDGADDGLFPASRPDLPLLPPHIAPSQIDLDLSVGNHSGRRYSNNQQLILRVWGDFDSDGVYAPPPAPDEYLVDQTSTPAAWGGDTHHVAYGVSPPEDHYRGDPLRLRARLFYAPEGGASGPDGAQGTGEVEDHQVLNFFEDFDTPDFHGAPFAILEPDGGPPGGGWVLSPDPPPGGFPLPPGNHNQWHYAMANLIFCMGNTVDKLLTVPDVPLDLRELTYAHVRIHVIHAICVGCPDHDFCRLAVRSRDSINGPFVENVILNFAQPDFCTNQPAFNQTVDLDLSAYCGKFVQLVVHHNTQIEDQLAIDDVAVYGYDARPPFAPVPTSTTTANRISTANWTNMNENNPIVPGGGIISWGALYALRLAVDGGAFNWANGFRLTPRDFANGSGTYPLVGQAGTPATTALRIPTTFPNLALAIREGDEAENLGPAGTTTLTVTPTFSVDVFGPPTPMNVVAGQTLDLDFVVTNQSGALDALTISVGDTSAPDWMACPDRRTRVLAPAGGATERVHVGVPSNATPGTSDTITMTVTSLSDGTKIDAASVVLNVVGGGNPCIGELLCSGDGTSGPCPCANTGIAGRGCDNSDLTGGSQLCVTGNPSLSADTLVLTASSERATAFSLFLQGTAQIAPVVFGDGLRCTGGTLKRLYSRSAVAGTVIAPIAGELSVSARSAQLGNPIQMNEIRMYQVYYRDPVEDFCPSPPGGNFNVSNAVKIVWGP